MIKHDEEWVTIPVATNYEMDRHGRVRNRETGQILKVQKRGKSCRVLLRIAPGHRKCFSINNLSWMTHGRVKSRTTVAFPVIATKGNERYYFNSLRATAKFLVVRENYSYGAVFYHLVKRRKEVYGWRINYQR